VGCGVCDTPELGCGAAGLCARVRARVLVPPNLYTYNTCIHTKPFVLYRSVYACAGAAESLHTYIHTTCAGAANSLHTYIHTTQRLLYRVLIGFYK